jgi:hypothetical protein
MSDRKRAPSYRLHKQSGQAVVTLPYAGGRRHDVLLGTHGSPESYQEYARVLGEWQAGKGSVPRGKFRALDDLTVNELLLAYVPFLEEYYRRTNGKPTSEVGNIKAALRPLRVFYGHTPAAQFDVT